MDKSSNHWKGSKIRRRLGDLKEFASTQASDLPPSQAHRSPPRSKGVKQLMQRGLLVGTARYDPQSLIGLALLARGIVPPCLCGRLAALVLYSAAVPARPRRARCLDRPRW